MIFFICIVIFTVIQSSSTKIFSRINDNSTVFNKIKTSTAFFIFVLMSISGIRLHGGTAVYGCVYGLLLCISLHGGYMALATGPMSLTSMIVSFSVLIPIIYGVCFCGEKLNMIKIIGILLFVVAIVFTNINKESQNNKGKRDLKWAMYVSVTFAANGFCSVIQKMHQEQYNSEYCLEFMLFAMLICFIVFIPVHMKEIPIKTLINAKGKQYAILSGIANAIVCYLTIKLAGYENASVLFPAISAGTILCTLLAGVIVFKEKLKYNHVIALVCGVAAVVLLKI